MNYTLEIVAWHEVKEQVNKLNPDIAEEIDALPVENIKNMPLVRARYPFGAAIESKDDLWVYYKDQPMKIQDERITADIRDLLDYPWKGIPVGMLTHNTIEWYVDLPSHMVPVRLVKPGTIFSLYSLFDPAINHVMHGAYSSTAGCRSLLMLPKISHQQYNDRLSKAFNIHEHLCPKTLPQQWYLFKEISDSEQFDEDWYCEMLFFPRQMLEHLRRRMKFRDSLMKRIWEFTSFSRNAAMYDLLWAIFTEKLPNSIRNTPFIIETAKHVVKMAMRQVPCYKPATSDLTAPIRKLTEAFLNIYRIRYYLPIFMQPEMYNGRYPVYYSLHKHTFFHPIPERSNANRTISEMSTIKQLVLDFTERVLNQQFPMSLDDTVLYQTLKEVHFEFFHPQGGSNLNNNIDQIPQEDKRFMSIVNELKIEKDLVFPDHSIFFNGCIRVMPNENAETRPSMKDFISMMATHDKKFY